LHRLVHIWTLESLIALCRYITAECAGVDLALLCPLMGSVLKHREYLSLLFVAECCYILKVVRLLGTYMLMGDPNMASKGLLL
jgi:hypothetical protein